LDKISQEGKVDEAIKTTLDVTAEDDLEAIQKAALAEEGGVVDVPENAAIEDKKKKEGKNP
jgi:hypothetical protein